MLEICDSAVGCTPIQTVGSGELLGWSPVLGASELTSTARTLAATRAFQISGAQVRSLCQQSPEFGFQIFRAVAQTLASRLTATRLQLVDVFRDDAQATES